jgi:hypothetical protein
MTEKSLIVNAKELKYKGVFRVDELFNVINKALEEKGYSRSEKKTEEVVTEQGRRTFLELRPMKKLTHYMALGLKIKITLDNLTQSVEEHDGKRVYDMGNVFIIFDSWIVTEFKKRWVQKPWVYFAKGLINKYIYSFSETDKAKGQLVGDTAYIYAMIKNLFQSYKHKTGKHTKESEVVRKVEDEIKKDIEKEFD